MLKLAADVVVGKTIARALAINIAQHGCVNNGRTNPPGVVSAADADDEKYEVRFGCMMLSLALSSG